MTDFVKEACVENLSQAITAEKKGADRIELCAHLDVGGTTPSRELIKSAHQNLSIPIRVMVRPRGGHFHYSNKEILQMKHSIDVCKEIGVEGVVFGILNEDHSLDLETTIELIQYAAPLQVVLHKAIDATPDPVQSFNELLSLEGITTVLTSGGQPTAEEGIENLMKMIEVSAGRIEVMPGGKVTDKNVEDLHRLLGASAYHGKKIVGEL